MRASVTGCQSGSGHFSPEADDNATDEQEEQSSRCPSCCPCCSYIHYESDGFLKNHLQYIHDSCDVNRDPAAGTEDEQRAW